MLAFGGSCEIRTHGTFLFVSFQDCWFKPLTQTSNFELRTGHYRPQARMIPEVPPIDKVALKKIYLQNCNFFSISVV